MKIIYFVFVFLTLIISVKSICSINLDSIICNPPLNVTYLPYSNIYTKTINLNDTFLTKIPFYSDDNIRISLCTTKVLNIEGPIPTVGGPKNVTILCIATYISNGEYKFQITETGFSISNPLEKEDTSVYYVVNFPIGCGTKSFLGYNYNYENPTYSANKTLTYETFTTTGNNLWGSNITITDLYNQNIERLGYDKILDPTHTIISFNYSDFKYHGNWMVNLKICNQDSFQENYFIKNEPIIYSWNSVDSKGGKLTITGKYITSKNNSNPKVRVGINECKSANYSTPLPEFSIETIICDLSAKEGTSNPSLMIVIFFDGINVTADGFKYDQPTITKVVQNKSTMAKLPNYGVFTIFGTHFTKESIMMAVVYTPGFNNIPIINYCNISNFVDNSTLEVELPLNSYPKYIMLIANKGTSSQVESPVYKSFVIEPTFTNISSSDTQGSTVTIRGSSIHTIGYSDSGNVSVDISVIINGKECKNFKEGDGTYITCDAPSGSGSQLSTSIIYEQYSDHSLKFNYNKPFINGNKQFVNGTIKLTGNNFGNMTDQVKLLVKNSNVDILTVDHNTFMFEIPYDAFGSVPIQLSVGPDNPIIGYQQPSNNYSLPILPVISSVSNTNCSGGIATINGQFLSKDMIVYFRNTTSPFVKNVPCSIVESITNNVTTCKVNGRNGQQGNSTTYTSGKGLLIDVSYLGEKGFVINGANFSFNPPFITEIKSENNSIVTSSNTITIMGYNFNRQGLDILIGKRKCKNPYIIEEFKTVECSLPSLESDSKSYNELAPEIDKNNGTLFVNVYITVDDQTTIFYPFIYNNTGTTIIAPIKNNNYGIYAAIVICSVIGALTIASVVIYKVKRYIRLKSIDRIMEKKIYEYNLPN